MESIGIF